MCILIEVACLNSFFIIKEKKVSNDLFDFDQPNLRDIEIVNNANQYIGITSGHKLTPLSRTTVSRLFMTIEQFKAALPTSALPAYIRNGGVSLKAILTNAVIADNVKQTAADTEKKAAEGEVEKDLVTDETGNTGLGEIVKETEDNNPFTSETNEASVKNGPPTNNPVTNKNNSGNKKQR